MPLHHFDVLGAEITDQTAAFRCVVTGRTFGDLAQRGFGLPKSGLFCDGGGNEDVVGLLDIIVDHVVSLGLKLRLSDLYVCS